ncbi:CGI-121-domain-containing protein [Zopfia rhizophila CBS 207.26]|uniref:EKC/KEOPS complex subunit CGI121 n=1 Tax=Zopfia rhizophila CBS 207.26 TaxID=1314779 RepID=A0A6A6E4E9_9PEZI|nr:CGI-121-domain-containing protein [Zopfia rhizophila CBS 207.26]
MAAVQTFYLPHYPTYPIYVCMFKDVSNADFLRSQLLEANPKFDYAFLDATMILSLPHLLSASFLALHSHVTHRSKTRTPHSELVFRLHPSNNIGESYKRFGISDSTTYLIAVKIGLGPETTAESVMEHLSENVKGEAVLIGGGGLEIGMWANEAKVRKVYKLENKDAAKKEKNGAVNGVDRAEANQRQEVESVILGMVSLKGS